MGAFILKAQGVAGILVENPFAGAGPLAELTEDKMYALFRDFSASYKMLREAIIEARHSHSDNVTVFPPKPGEPGRPRALRSNRG